MKKVEFCVLDLSWARIILCCVKEKQDRVSNITELTHYNHFVITEREKYSNHS